MTTAKHRLLAAWKRTDALFERLPDLFARTIPLRHPFVFYLGHLPAFAWNHLAVGVLGKAPKGPFDKLFAFGIDPENKQAAAELSISKWPSVEAIIAYRDQVRTDVLELLPELASTPGVMAERGRIVHMVAEHELLHQETLLYMVQAGGYALQDTVVGGDGEPATQVSVPAGTAVLGTDFDSLDFGWDNEFPKTQVQVSAFAIDSLPVRIVDWQAFVAEGGPVPDNWQGDTVRTLAGIVPRKAILGWPVQVSQQQAVAYARWKGRRLPTEAELARVRHLPAGANVNVQRFTPVPVGTAGPSPSGVREVVGNGWEWTQTLWRPLPGFKAYIPSYPGFSADFFDERHVVMVGGSWATDASLLRSSFRNWFPVHYPYVFSKFRTVAV